MELLLRREATHGEQREVLSLQHLPWLQTLRFMLVIPFGGSYWKPPFASSTLAVLRREHVPPLRGVLIALQFQLL